MRAPPQRGDSYLEAQSSRGSVISRALNAYGHNAFSLSILSIGPTLSNTDQVYSTNNLPDFVKLEQIYLSLYDLVYNVNRIASSAAYIPSSTPINKGENNPSFGSKGINAFVWGNTLRKGVMHLKSFDLIHVVNFTFMCTIILLINYLIHLVVQLN